MLVKNRIATTQAKSTNAPIWRNTFSQCVMQKQMGQSSSWQSCPDSIARKQEESKTKASKSKHAMAAASMRPCPLPALGFPFTVSNMIRDSFLLIVSHLIIQPLLCQAVNRSRKKGPGFLITQGKKRLPRAKKAGRNAPADL